MISNVVLHNNIYIYNEKNKEIFLKKMQLLLQQLLKKQKNIICEFIQMQARFLIMCILNSN
jgi:hypothetical protein